MENGMENMLDMYLFETNTLLEQLDEILLNAEKEGDFSTEDVNEIFRIMHTIKGSSAMMQFSSLMTVAHRIEDLFYSIREKGVNASYKIQLFDLMFKSTDFLKDQVDKIQNSEPLEENVDAFEKEISDFLKITNGEPVELEYESTEKAPVQKDTQAQSSLGIKVFFDEGSGMENLRAFMLVTSIKEVCDDFTYLPKDIETDSSTANAIVEDGFNLYFKSQDELDNAVLVVKDFVNIKTYEVFGEEEPEEEVKQAAETVQQVVGVAVPAVVAAPKAAQPKREQVSTKQSLISVNLAKLDKLMDIVGEIVITEAMVTATPEVIDLNSENFNKSARQLRMMTDELQNIVMSIRMVPVSGVFQKMNRIVRDVGQSLKKDVKLTIIGAETEVDKTIVDSIGDPIMHMVRNSMDHGIETDAQERLALGKPAQGEIVLSAQHTGNDVIITIKDDGRGINTQKVLEKAKLNNLLTKPETEYTEKEIQQMILLPGFSTKSEVTEFSGRGVGMDVVKKNIEKVGGTVSISSEEGKGTTTTFKIPLTLAIMDGMKISVGGSIFIVPITNIRQSFKVTEGDLSYDANHNELIKRMGDFYPVIRLHEVFEIDGAKTDIGEGVVIWVESGDTSYGLYVDEIIGEQQVVIKPLPAFLAKYDIKNSGVTGCAILGDGSISVILDVQSFYDFNSKK